MIAVCVGKLYVNPVRSAIAIVAESPGSIPMTSPARVARHMTRRFIGCIAVTKAVVIYSNAIFHLIMEALH